MECTKSKHLNWFLIVCLLTAGCAPRKVVSLPAGAFDAPNTSDVLLKPGQTAKIYLVSGEGIEGKVVALTPEFVVIGQPGNYGLQQMKYNASEITKIEVASSDGGVDIAYFTIAAIVVGVLAVIVNKLQAWPAS